MSGIKSRFAAGMRVVIRDAEWLIKHVDIGVLPGVNNEPMQVLTCLGISNIVSGRLAKFVVEYEERADLKQKIQILDPKETRIVQDKSPGYVRSKLFIESLLRRTPATDAKIHIAQDAAMDVLPYQLKPALTALESTRPRILIADAVGIGKTLEAGILVSELIERQRGKRILVLAVKAMLEQFQQEFWNRFSIPLTRLDSDGIARLQQQIPAGHNPFLYVDKSIISIDTLKQSSQYSAFLEQAYWDIIVIDEAHNVAERGTDSMRSRLARLLSRRSDALIMLSATPHDGKPESFASLIDMLDPTVIADPSNYSPEDFKDKGLVIRRFKNDIRDQAKEAFPERDIQTLEVQASDVEKAAYSALEDLKFTYIDSKRKSELGAMLFKTNLEKALFSSPAACISTCVNRIKKLNSMKDPSKGADDVATLEAFLDDLRKIDKTNFSKYQALVKLLKGVKGGFEWNPKVSDDRLVIFTESRQTLKFLADHLPSDLGLKVAQYCVLKGDDSDKDLMDCVEKFNKKDSPLRLMLATDVASEGLNLHHLCHRMIHFDIPWSLMTFQQRNGRIDRYGQTKQPIIRYLQTLASTSSGKFIGDAHIMKLLVEKDKNAVENIADPGEFAGSREEQEARTAAQIQGEIPVNDAFGGFDFLNPLASFSQVPEEAFFAPVEEDILKRSLLFKSDYDFLKAGLRLRKSLDVTEGGITTEVDINDEDRRIRLLPPKDLEVRLKYLPKEVLPENQSFELSDSKEAVQEAIRNANLNPNSSWPTLQLLWEMHPVTQWMEDWAIGSFGRHAAPVISVPDFADGEFWVLLQGGFPNKRGGTPVHDWLAVEVNQSGVVGVRSRKDLMARIHPQADWINTQNEIDTKAIETFMPDVVDAVKKALSDKNAKFKEKYSPIVKAKVQELNQLRDKQLSLFNDLNATKLLTTKDVKRLARQEYIEKCFRETEEYVANTYELDAQPYVQVVAVFTGKPMMPTLCTETMGGNLLTIF